jgi:ketopantoate reductase (EC 1.1.1.169)
LRERVGERAASAGETPQEEPSPAALGTMLRIARSPSTSRKRGEVQGARCLIDPTDCQSLSREDFMKICIYGAGAIGGYLGVQLARAGADVSLVARGAHLAAMRERGLTLLAGEEQHTVHPRCTDDPAELGVQDYIIITLKAHSITGVIEKMQPLLGPRTRIVTAVNGIPYWYFYKHGGQYENSTLESIDPGGRQWREIGAERAIGCIVYPATEIEAPA